MGGGKKKKNKDAAEDYDLDTVFSSKKGGNKPQLRVMKATRNPNEVQKQGRKR